MNKYSLLSAVASRPQGDSLLLCFKVLRSLLFSLFFWQTLVKMWKRNTGCRIIRTFLDLTALRMRMIELWYLLLWAVFSLSLYLATELVMLKFNCLKSSCSVVCPGSKFNLFNDAALDPTLSNRQHHSNIWVSCLTLDARSRLALMLLSVMLYAIASWVILGPTL